MRTPKRRRRGRPAPQPAVVAQVQVLEERTLLSADLLYSAVDNTPLTARVAQVANVDTVQVVETGNTSNVLKSRPLADFMDNGGLEIQAGTHDVVLTIDDTAATIKGGIHFDGGTGNSTLIGPGGNQTWGITGSDTGTIGSFLSFQNVENLTGQGGSDDTFNIANGGTISGTIDAGEQGNSDSDSLNVTADGTTTISGNDGNATLNAGGVSTEIDGFESVTLSGGTGADTLDASGYSGDITLRGQGGGDTLRGGTGDDTLEGGTGDDTYEFASGFGTDVITDAGGSADKIVASISNDMTLTDTQLSAGSDSVSFSGIEQAELTAGNGKQTLSVNGFAGTVKLAGGNGPDNYDFGATFGDVTIADNGGSLTGFAAFLATSGNRIEVHVDSSGNTVIEGYDSGNTLAGRVTVPAGAFTTDIALPSSNTTDFLTTALGRLADYAGDVDGAAPFVRRDIDLLAGRSIGDIVGVGRFVETQLQQPVGTLDSSATLDELVRAVHQTGVGVTGVLQGNDLTVDFDLNLSRTLSGVELALGTQAEEFLTADDLTADVETTIDWRFNIALDGDAGNTADAQMAFDFGSAGTRDLTVSAKIDKQIDNANDNFRADAGVLGLDVGFDGTNGSRIQLDDGSGGAVSIALETTAVNAGNPLDSTALAALKAKDLNVLNSPAAQVDLDLHATVPSVSGFGSPATLQFQDDVFDGLDPAAPTNNFDSLGITDFQLTTASTMRTQLEQFALFALFFDEGALTQNSLQVPFTSGTNLGELFDLQRAFQENVLDALQQGALTTSTPLSELNLGLGVRFVAGADFHVQLADGTEFDVDFDNSLATVGDLMNAIKAASGLSASDFDVRLDPERGGFMLIDGTTGSGEFQVTAVNGSPALTDLGLTGQPQVDPAVTGTFLAANIGFRGPNFRTVQDLFARLTAASGAVPGSLAYDVSTHRLQAPLDVDVAANPISGTILLGGPAIQVSGNLGDDGSLVGREFVIRSGPLSGQIRRISANSYDETNDVTTIELDRSFGSTPADGTSFEITPNLIAELSLPDIGVLSGLSTTSQIEVDAGGTLHLPLEFLLTPLGSAVTETADVADLNSGAGVRTELGAKASGVFALNGNATDGETVTIGAKSYTFQTTLTDVDGNVQIGADALETLANLAAAVNRDAGAGTAYAASTTLHPTAVAAVDGLELTVEAKQRGPAGNGIATTDTVANGEWAKTTLEGGTAFNDIRVQLAHGTAFEADLDHDPGDILLSSVGQSGVALDSGDDLQITLSNGENFNVNLNGATTVGDVVRLIEIAFAAAVASNNNIDAGDFEVRVNAARGTVELVDFSDPASQNPLAVTDLGSSDAANLLGLAGTPTQLKLDDNLAHVKQASFFTLGDLLQKVRTAWQAHATAQSLDPNAFQIRINADQTGLDVIDGTSASVIENSSVTPVSTTENTFVFAGPTNALFGSLPTNFPMNADGHPDLTGYTVRFEWVDDLGTTDTSDDVAREAVRVITGQDDDGTNTMLTIAMTWDNAAENGAADPVFLEPKGTVRVSLPMTVAGISESPSRLDLGLFDLAGAQAISEETAADQVGLGIQLNDAGTDLAVTLHDGTTFEVNLGTTAELSTKTVGDLLNAIVQAAQIAGVGSDEILLTIDTATSRPALVDFTTGSTTFAISDINGSNAASTLGLSASAQNTTDFGGVSPYVITVDGPGVFEILGNIIHGDEPGQHVGVSTRGTDRAKLTTNLRLKTAPLASGLDVAGTSGPFGVGVDSQDAGGVDVSFDVVHMLEDPGNQAGSDFATFTELSTTPTDQMSSVAGTPAIAGTLNSLSLEVGLDPVPTSSTLNGFTENVIYSATSVDLTDTTALESLAPTVKSPDVNGKSAALKDLLNAFSGTTVDDVLSGFQSVADYLADLQNQAQLNSNENLLSFVVPGLGRSVAELIDLRSTFDSLLAAFDAAAPTTFQELETILSGFLSSHFGTPTISLSHDTSAGAIKIELANLSLAQQNISLPFDLNLLPLVPASELTSKQLTAASIIRDGDPDNTNEFVTGTVGGTLNVSLGIQAPVAGKLTADSSGTDLVNSGASFTQDLVGRRVTVVDANGSEQTRTITAVTATTLTVDAAFTVVPAKDSDYTIHRSFLYGAGDGSETALSLNLSASQTGLDFTTLMRSTSVKVFTDSQTNEISSYGFHKKGDSQSPAVFAATLTQNATAGDADSSTATALDAEVSTTLHLEYPPELTQPTVPITFAGTDLASGTVSTFTLTGPTVDSDLGNVDLLENLDGFRLGFDQLLGELDAQIKEKMFEDRVDTSLTQENALPLVGNQLAEAIDFLDQIRDKMSDNLATVTARLTPESARQALFEALGPGGLNWLTDRNADGDVTIADVVMTASRTLVTFDVGIEVPESLTQFPVEFDSGLPNLGLDINSLVNVKAGFKFPNLQLGFSTGGDGTFLGVSSSFAPVTGTATSAAADASLTDSGASFASSLVGKQIQITAGTGIGQTRAITAVPSGSNLTLDSAWTTPLDTTSQYRITDPEFVITLDASLPQNVLASGTADTIPSSPIVKSKLLETPNVSGGDPNKVLDFSFEFDVGDTIAVGGGSYSLVLHQSVKVDGISPTGERISLGFPGMVSAETINRIQGGTTKLKFEVSFIQGLGDRDFILRYDARESKILTDADGSFSDDLIGERLTITSGTGAGQSKIIAGRSGNNLSFFTPWDTLPDSTSQYVIEGGLSGKMGILPVKIFENTAPISGTATANAEVTTTANVPFFTGRQTLMLSVPQLPQTGGVVTLTLTNPPKVPGGYSLSIEGVLSRKVFETDAVETINLTESQLQTLAADNQVELTIRFKGDLGHLLLNPPQITAALTYNLDASLTDSNAAFDSSLVQVVASGTATSASESTLTDTSTIFDSHVEGMYVVIVSGTGSGQARRITTASGRTLTIDGAWDTTPDATSRYEIQAPTHTLRIYAGAGAGQEKRIVAVESATKLIVESFWGVAIETTSKYQIRNDYAGNVHGTNFVRGSYVVDLVESTNDRLSFTELANPFKKVVNGGFTGEAALNLQLFTDLPAGTAFPPYRMALGLGPGQSWTFQDGVETAPTSLEFNDVAFDIVGFMRDFVGPGLHRMNKAMEPLQGLARFLNSAAFPILSLFFGYSPYATVNAFGGKKEIGDLAQAMDSIEKIIKGGDPFEGASYADRVLNKIFKTNRDAVKGLIPIDSLTGQAWIDLGRFTVAVDDAREPRLLKTGARNIPVIASSQTASFAEIAAQIGALSTDLSNPARFAAKAFITTQNLPGVGVEGFLGLGLGGLFINLHDNLFDYSILQRTNSYQILLGHVALNGKAPGESFLYSYSTPELFVRLQRNIPLSLIKALKSLSGETIAKLFGGGGSKGGKKSGAEAYPYLVVAFEAKADFGAAFDTTGLQSFAVTGNAADIENGFFLDDSQGVEDTPGLLSLNADAGNINFLGIELNPLKDEDQSRILGGVGLGFGLEYQLDLKLATLDLFAGIEGTFFIGESLNLIDPNHDFRVRANEFDRQLANPDGRHVGTNKSPEKWLMYNVGIGTELRVDVNLLATLAVKIPLLKSLANLTLIDLRLNLFTLQFPDIILNAKWDQSTPTLTTRTVPTFSTEETQFLQSLGLGTTGLNVLNLNGPDGLKSNSSAAQTIYVGPDSRFALGETTKDTISDNQRVVVSNTQWGQGFKSSTGWIEEATNVLGFDVIIAQGGSGDDLIVISPDLKVPVIVLGGGGNDTLIAGGGPALLLGGAGNDVLIGGNLGDWLFGQAGADDIFGGDGNDLIVGGIGADKLVGWRDDDKIYGDDWTADSAGSGDTIDAGTGNDVVHAGGGADTVAGGLGDDVIYGEAGADSIQGGDGSDTIFGGGDNDTIEGGLGNDVIDGEAGDDTIRGGEHRDNIQGGAGNDLLDGEGATDQVRGGAGNDVITAKIGNDFLDGEDGSDDYLLGFQGGFANSLVTVLDTGVSGTDTDRFFATGTVNDDDFLLRASTSGKAFVALINSSTAVERIDYTGVERISISGSFGDDYFAVDDTAAEITLNGDEGADTFQIGQLFRSPRTVADANVDPGDVFATIETTRGYLSNGASFPMTVNGGSGNDRFVVYHNKAVLSLNGDAGDDEFDIKAFALVGSQEPERARTDISGGAGADLVQYSVNAPVNIDGGDGSDTLIVTGTEFGDDFVITKDGVYGAGLTVNFSNIESLRVDGAEGDDRFYIQSTDPNVVTELYGGLGNDTFNASGDAPPVVSNDLLGHSGLILHDAISLDPRFDGQTLFGISANVADNDEPGVVIRQSDGSTIITEGSSVADSYQVALTTAPTTDVFVKALAPIPTDSDRERRRRAFSVSSMNFDAVNAADGTSVTLKFTPTNWFIPQTVFVAAGPTQFTDAAGILTRPELGDSATFTFDDSAVEGVRFASINHTVQAGNDQRQGDLGTDTLASISGTIRVIAEIGGTITAGDVFSIDVGGTTVPHTAASTDSSIVAYNLASAVNAARANATITDPVRAVALQEFDFPATIPSTVLVDDEIGFTFSSNATLNYTVVAEDVGDAETLLGHLADRVNGLNLRGVTAAVENGSLVIREVIPSTGAQTVTVKHSRGQTTLLNQQLTSASRIVLTSDDADSTTDDRTDFTVSTDSAGGTIELLLDGGNGTSTAIGTSSGYSGSVIGRRIDIISGPGAGQSRFVVADDGSGILTVERPWDVGDLPEFTSDYRIVIDDALVGTGATVDNTNFTFTDSSATFPTAGDGLTGRVLQIVGGPGAGQERLILSNTATELTLNGAWSTPPTAESVYRIELFDGLAVPSVKVQVNDNDEFGIIVEETGDGTAVIEGGDGITRVKAFTTSSPVEIEFAGSVDAGDRYQINIGTTTVSYTAVDGDSLSDVRDALVMQLGNTATAIDGDFTGLSLSLSQPTDISVGIVNDAAPNADADINIRAPQAGEQDNIKVRLTKAPTSGGGVTVALVNSDGQLNFSSNSLTFNSTNATIFQTVTVSGTDDSVREGFHSGLVEFLVNGGNANATVSVSNPETFHIGSDAPVFYVGLTQVPTANSVAVTVDGVTRDAGRYQVIDNRIVFTDSNGDPEAISGTIEVTYDYRLPGFSSTQRPRLVVGIQDDEAPTVLVRETGGSTDVMEVTTRQRTLATGSGIGTGTTIFFPLNFIPDGVDPVGQTISITSGPGAGQSRTITEFTEFEGFLRVTIDQAWSVPPDQTSVYTVTFDATGAPFDDGYELVLTAAPTDDVTVTVTPEVTKTTRTGGIRHDLVQVALSSSDSRVVANQDGTLTVTFSSSDWDRPVQIDVTAVDDAVVDGGDTKVFAPGPHTLSGILGPVIIEGGGGDGSLGAEEPLLLVGETNVKPTDAQVVTLSNNQLTVATAELQAGLPGLGVGTINELVDKTVEVSSLADTTDAAILDVLGQFRRITAVTQSGPNTVLTLNDGFYRSETTFEVTLSGTVEADDRYAVLVDGQPVSYVVQQSDTTLSDVAAGLRDAINSAGIPGITATASGAVVTVTAPPRTGLSTAVLNDAGTTDAGMSLNQLPRTALTGSEVTGIALTAESLNFFVNEATQVDVLFVHDEDSPADSAGLLTANSLTGLNMGPAGAEGFGITYGDLEVLDIDLGLGRNNFTVQGTPTRTDGFQTWTLLNTGDVADPNHPPTTDDDVTVKLNAQETTVSSQTVLAASSDADNGVGFVEFDGSFLSNSPTRYDLKGELVRTGDGQDRRIINTIAKHSYVVGSDTSPNGKYIIQFGSGRGKSAIFQGGSSVTAIAKGLVNAVNLLGLPGVTAEYTGGGTFVVFTDPATVVTEEIRDTPPNAGDSLTRTTTALVKVEGLWEHVPQASDTVDIVKEADGVFAVNTQGGNDVIDASASTLGIVAFGGLGNDRITGGSGEDILFGDRGRVDYFGESVPNTSVRPIVTRLGTAPEPITGTATAPFSNPLELRDANQTEFPVPTQDSFGRTLDIGLQGLFVDINNGTGFLQGPRLITGNDSNVLFVQPGFAPDLDATSKYRVSTTPEDQTDGVVRGANLLITVDDALGGDDRIDAGDGNDEVFGGAGVDTITGGTGDDVILGDAGVIERERTDAAPAVFDPTLPAPTVASRLDRIRTKSTTVGSGDVISGEAGADVILGGGGGDTVYGDDASGSHGSSDGDDILFGDFGEVDYDQGALTDIRTTDANAGASDTIVGNAGNDIILAGANSSADSVTDLSGDNIIFGDFGHVDFDVDGDPTDIDLIVSTDEATGGGDQITTGDGNDIVIGGAGDDTINTGNGKSIVIGDSGKITGVSHSNAATFGSLPIVIDQVESTSVGDGGMDTITGGTGDDLVIGGTQTDTINLGVGLNTLLGDTGSISFNLDGDPSDVDQINVDNLQAGSVDYITTGDDDDIIFGGAGKDVIDAGAGNNIVFGDFGKVDFVVDDNDPTDIDLITTLDPDVGDDDQITTGAGDDIIFGGKGTDTINAGEGSNIVFGDNGKITAATADSPRFGNQPIALGRIETTDWTIGDTDIITTGAGADVILGGLGGDVINAGDGDNIVLGDHGFIDYVGTDGDPADVDQIETDQTANGGADDVTTGSGNDIVLGGTAGDVIHAGAGNDLVFGDFARISGDVNATQLPLKTGTPAFAFTSIDTTVGDGGADEIYGEAGDDILLGQQGGDTIFAGAGDDDVIGGHNVAGGYDAGDNIDGGSGADVIAGDNAIITRRTDTLSPRIRVLGGATIYAGPGLDHTAALVTGASQSNPQATGGTVERDVTLLDHADNTDAALYGDDYIAGGAGDDQIFGQLGNDTIQGDGSIDGKVTPVDLSPAASGTGHMLTTLSGTTAVFDGSSPQVVSDENDTITIPSHGFATGELVTYTADSATVGGLTDGELYAVVVIDADTISLTRPVTAVRDNTGDLRVIPSAEASSDGDDYIEGNGGADVIFGNLGQDDIIGGSSDLFGLSSSNLRPDGADVIYGGAGTQADRNNLGDLSSTGHARDADTILGDNGNIFRLVGVNGTAGGDFLRFTYDSYDNSLPIVPRGVDLLDYTAGNNGAGPADIGDGDVIHGESGDDQIWAMAGNDIAFGDGQDDDVIGGDGVDRLYGGAGEDGIVGDNGLIQTSRNGRTETLYGLTTANSEEALSISGTFVGAVEYIDGRIDKSLTAIAWEDGGNDIIYGGLGDDFIHAGAGDDEVSGAEALPAFYNHIPQADLDPDLDALNYDPATTKFAAYDADHPFQKIDGFLLNFEATVSGNVKVEDGKDRIFGDLGNDWLVGGTGKDRMFGGLGDDLINADDNLDTNGGLNDQPDAPEFADGDFVYGGGGLDVMIANTGGDRMVDFKGEYNSFFVPFSQFGVPTVQRLPNPAWVDFVTDLARTSGADQSLSDPSSELGLVLNDTGASRDPQPGNIGGVSIDTQGAPEDDRGVLPTPAGSTPGAPTDGQNLLAHTSGQQPATATDLTTAELGSIIAAAYDRWDAVSPDVDPESALQNVRYQIVDLPGLVLGRFENGVVSIDENAAGFGWFIDATPHLDEEFATDLGDGVFVADAGSPAYGRYDLLSTVLHELGHAFGYEHDEDGGVMAESLPTGTRAVPVESDHHDAGAIDESAVATSPAAKYNRLTANSVSAKFGRQTSILDSVFADFDDLLPTEDPVVPANQTASFRKRDWSGISSRSTQEQYADSPTAKAEDRGIGLLELLDDNALGELLSSF
jgi:Ca2+-binding RTX toxin-like protein